MTIRTLIADDEPLARDLLRSWIGQDRRLRLVGAASQGEEVVQMVHSLQPRLLFLDIQMPALDGMAALRRVRAAQLRPYTVFVTAFAEHAATAFDLRANDYLVKPVQKRRFEQAVTRAAATLQERDQAELSKGSFKPLVVCEAGVVTALPIESIIWVQAASQYARIHCRSGSHLISRPLAELASRLPERLFVRVHRSALVNLQHVHAIHCQRGNYVLRLSCKQQAPLARSRRGKLLEVLQMAAQLKNYRDVRD